MSNVLSFFFMCNQTYDLGLWRILRRISPEFLANLSKFYLYGMIGGSTLLFTRDNRVFAYGFNGNGRLGVGHFRLDVSGQPEEIEELRNVKIFSVAGADFIVALVEDDNTHKCYLLTWGSNNHGQLGIGDQEDRCQPIRIHSINYNIDNGSLILLGTFNNEFQSDLCIKTYTYSHFVRKIFVQQRKLEEHSEYLRQLCLNRIEDDSEEACGRRLIIRRHTYLIVYAHVRYIYTGILRIDPLYTAELYDFAHEFEDNQLIQLIPEFLYHQTNLCSF